MSEDATTFYGTSFEERLRRPRPMLSGSVAAGARTADVLAFLIDALDLREDKERENSARGGGAPAAPGRALNLGGGRKRLPWGSAGHRPTDAACDRRASAEPIRAHADGEHGQKVPA